MIINKLYKYLTIAFFTKVIRYDSIFLQELDEEKYFDK